MDLPALKTAAERKDAGPMALVSRLWLGDVLSALLDPDAVKLLTGTDAPTPMVSA